MTRDLDESELRAELERISRRIDSIMKKVRAAAPSPQRPAEEAPPAAPDPCHPDLSSDRSHPE
jgi:hypothetical protein